MTIIRFGIFVLVAFAVLAEGGVEPWSQAILEIGAATLIICWGFLALRKRQAEIRRNWLLLPVAGLVAFAFAQCAFRFTVSPYTTKIELLKAGAYLVLSFLAVQCFPTTEDRAHFAWFLIAMGFFVSLLGIIQHLAFSGQIYWFWPLLPGTLTSFGPYVNPNHFAGFVELTCPMGIAMLLSGAVPKERIVLAGLFTTLPVGALILCGSRGGLASFFMELILLGFLVRRHEGTRISLLTAAGLALMACILVLWLGTERISHRLATLSPAELSHDRRVSLFQDTAQIFVSHPWTGTGLGTLQVVFPRYETYYDGLIVDHAHNDYLELLADMGLVGGACGLVFLGILFWQGRNNLRLARNCVTRAFYLGAFAACTGLLLHSLTDFNFHIPSNALLFLLLASLLTSSPEATGHATATHRTGTGARSRPNSLD